MYLRNRVNVLLILLTIFLNCSIDDPHNEIVVYEENKTRITLLNVADYRCPSDVLCFWSGNAEVLMRMQKNGQSEDFVLNTHGEIPMP
ncbi:hypothetical protein [Winogradskyella sp. PG-2]|uniref:hypothetical protein n=1 Tax=Winogradskyella sp. PG-2 TaxID=754409 RepID=UPI0004586186|nr:hypothetical protein [Winogradskyella sp. PG-2]BAO77178.1 hypothetical protein WPG_2948 [Winogradskyella sp. PG-2]